MGMYDNLWCRRLLPDGLDGNEYTFQTKDLECCLFQYEIREDGLLVQYEVDEDGEINRSVPPRLIDYHGYIKFYHGITNKTTYDVEWHEYAAKFTDGKLVEITAKPPKTY